MPMGEGPNDAGLSRHHLIEGCEASLRRLRTDHIDLYQVHEWDGQTPLEETLDALDALVRAGKVRYVGCSNYAAWQLVKALGISERLRPAALRQPADLLLAAGARGRVRAGARRARPGSGDPRLEPARRRPAVGQVPPRRRSPRRAATSPTGASRRSATASSSTTSSTRWWRSARATASRPRRSRSPTRSAKPGVTSLVIGARKEEQLADNLAAADLELAADERARLDEVSAPPLLYPYWHQAKTASDRLGDGRPDAARAARGLDAPVRRPSTVGDRWSTTVYRAA